MNAPAMSRVTYASGDCFRLKGVMPVLRQVRTLLAKELHENRWLMVTGLVLMAADPLQYALWRETYDHDNGAAIGVMGIFFAALIGITTSVRDLSPTRVDFWRSRAIGTGRFVSVKWMAGFVAAFLPALVMVAAEVVLCHYRFQPDASWGRGNYDLSRLMGNATSLLTFAVGAYAVAFCIGSFVRRGVDATILTATALLILWLLPLVVPALAWLNVSTLPHGRPLVAIGGGWGRYDGDQFWRAPWLNWVVIYHPPYLKFAAGVLLVTVATVVLSQFAVRRDWKIEMDRKLILWSLGGSAVLLVLSMLWTVRSNLEPTQELQVFTTSGRPCIVSQFIDAGDQTWAIGYDPASRGVNPDNKYAHYAWRLQQRGGHWSASAPFSLGALEPSGLTSNDHYRFLWSPVSPDLLYATDVVARRSYDAKTRSWGEATFETHLRTFSLSLQGKLIDVMDLGPLLDNGPGSGIYNATVASGKLIMASWRSVLVFESRPDAGPRFLTKSSMDHDDWRFALERVNEPYGMFGENKPRGSLSYPVIAELPLEGRLSAGLALSTHGNYRGFLEDKSLLCYHKRDLRSYQLTGFEAGYALVRPGASLEAFSLEKVMHGTDPMVYGRQGRWYWQIDWGGGVTLYEIAPQTIRRAGHFNRPHDRFRTAAVVADRTLLVGGAKVYAIEVGKGESAGKAGG